MGEGDSGFGGGSFDFSDLLGVSSVCLQAVAIMFIKMCGYKESRCIKTSGTRLKITSAASASLLCQTLVIINT